MNSDHILRELNRLANDKSIGHAQRRVINSAMDHIRHQDREMSELREDITELPPHDPAA